MANRDNHYEAAFEELLRQHGVPYVAVDEAKRSVLADGQSIKSLDFIVAAAGSTTWLVDVKGRRFPSGDDESKQYWRNWSTRDDLTSLAHWEQLFGANFLRTVGLRLQHRGQSGAAAGRSTLRVPRRTLRLRGRSAGRLCRVDPRDLAALGYGRHAYGRVPATGPAILGVPARGEDSPWISSHREHRGHRDATER